MNHRNIVLERCSKPVAVGYHPSPQPLYVIERCDGGGGAPRLHVIGIHCGGGSLRWSTGKYKASSSDALYFVSETHYHWNRRLKT